jgi:hypothetical protein
MRNKQFVDLKVIVREDFSIIYKHVTDKNFHGIVFLQIKLSGSNTVGVKGEKPSKVKRQRSEGVNNAGRRKKAEDS